MGRLTCWWCGGQLIWNGDFDKSDVYDDPEMEGMVSYLHCMDCGARVTYETCDDDDWIGDE